MAITKEEINKKREKELSLLFYKTMTCPVCEKIIKFRTIKSGKLRIDGTDDDMRPHYYGVDANKYHVVVCPECGFSALQRYFEPMPPRLVKLIQEKVCANHTPEKGDPEIITYRGAFERYHKAITCAAAKGAKSSELSYLYLKTAWLLRGEREELISYGMEDKAKALEPVEQNFLKYAYNGFVKARMEEGYPMCGMDEVTVDYLVGALAISQGEYDTATKLLSSVVTSYAANGRMKDRARELREALSESKKNSQ